MGLKVSLKLNFGQIGDFKAISTEKEWSRLLFNYSYVIMKYRSSLILIKIDKLLGEFWPSSY